MNRYQIRLVIFLNLTLIVSNCPGEIDVDHYSIGGSGPEHFRFVILSDPQVGTGGSDIGKLAEAVDKVIELNNDTESGNDVEFAVILGDLIQGGESKGELEYRQEYEQVLAELERLEADCPNGAGIPYIPVIGNHDVWFQLTDYTVVDDFPDYPEELFYSYFAPQYGELSFSFANWIKQETMPSANPYRLDFPAPYFQNFAFDYGPYHLIFLDFSARDDFDPISPGLIIPRLKKFTGYADLHDFNNGTWEWLTTHLEECRSLGVHNVIVFSHHPPLYQLEVHTGNPAKIRTTPYPFALFAATTEVKGEMHILNDPDTTLSNYRTGVGFESWDGQILFDNTEVDRAEGDVLLGFNKQDYDGQDEYDRLALLFNSYGVNIINWFSGHYHVKGLQWDDSNINTTVTAVPSVAPASMLSRMEFDGSAIINEQTSAEVSPQNNPNGSITVVRVLGCYADFDKDADVTLKDFAYLASQWLSSPGEPSADIAPIPDGDGVVNLLDLAAFVEYWLKGCK